MAVALAEDGRRTGAGSASGRLLEDGRPLNLPLSHSTSPRNLLPRRAHSRSYRRHLEKAGVRNVSNARMPLFDDLLHHGYYTTRLHIGTPPQEFTLIVDSGSTVTYVPCSTCENCGKHQVRVLNFKLGIA